MQRDTPAPPAPPAPDPGSGVALWRNDPNLTGAIWVIVSCIGATAMSVAVKQLSGELHTVQIAFLRSILGIWVLLPMFRRRAGAQRATGLRFTRPVLHLLRGLLFVGAVNCGFYALSELPLATATTLFFLAPVFTTAFAALFTAETVGARRWSAVGAGFLGAVIVLRPGFAALDIAMIAAIGSSVMFAISLLITRPLAAADGPNSMMVSTTLLAALLLLPPAAAVWQPVPVAAWGIVALLVAGSTLRMFADIRAYSTADAGFLAPFAFLRLLFIAVAGWVFFREGLDGPTLVGAAVIVGSTVFIARREAQLRRAGRGS